MAIIKLGSQKIPKSPEEIEAMRRSGAINSACLEELARRAQPGVTGLDLDAIAAKFIKAAGAEAAFNGYLNYPFNICVGINHGVIHCMPDDSPFEEGDIVSIDVGVVLDNWFTDACITVFVGEVSDEAKLLCSITREALQKGLRAAAPDQPVGVISNAIQSYVESQGLNIVVGYNGHGIGRLLHEAPTIPNVGSPDRGAKLVEGLTVCVEPLVTLGAGAAYLGEDEWSVYTADHMLAAHFEQTVAITSKGVDVLTPHDFLNT